MQAKEARRYDRYVQFAAAAATEALKDAGLDFVGNNEAGDRAGCIIGSGIGGLETICVNHKAMLERGPRRISPFMIPGCIINMASGLVGIMKNLRGPNLATVTACATGLHAIGEAAWIIRRGDADVMLAGAPKARFARSVSVALTACMLCPVATTIRLTLLVLLTWIAMVL